ncbi:MAG: SGNH/GDSL hydrolase family protein [Paracoccaceae bacterium]
MAISAPNLVFFGDSLTDNGNLFNATQGVIPDVLRDLLGGPTNAASDGPTHAAYTSALLGLTSVNYAVAAGRAIGSYQLGDVIDSFGLSDIVLTPPDDARLDFDINLSAQIDRFQDDFSGHDLSDITAVLLIGSNDFQDIDTSNPLNLVSEAVATIVGTVSSTIAAAVELVADGVGNVVISNLPPVEFFPAFYSATPLERAGANLALDAHNGLISGAVDALNALGANVHLLDIASMARAIAEDPTGFGLIAPYDATQRESDVLETFDADQIAFWDSIHPTTATHGVLGAHNAHFLSGGEISALTDGNDARVLGGDDDLVLAYGGSDAIDAGGGDDLVFVGTGNDSVLGNAGDDLISGGAGNDAIVGAAGADILDGDGGNDTLQGGAGDDLLIDGLGSDVLQGGADDDTFVFTQSSLIGGLDGATNDTFLGGAGLDTLYLVLDTATSTALSPFLQGPTQATALSLLGITASGIESVQVLTERSALSELSGEDWYDRADIWGLI